MLRQKALIIEKTTSETRETGMPINIVAKTVPAIAMVCGFILMFYYGGAYANDPLMVETGMWMFIGGFVLQVLWLFLFRRRR